MNTENQNQKRSWMYFAGLEAGIRSIMRLMQEKIASSTQINIGQTNMGFLESLTATSLIGAVQAIISLTLAILLKRKIWPGGKYALYSLFFGIMAFIGTTFGISVFFVGGELSVSSFIIIGLAILPGALIDRIFFGQKLSFIQILGLGLMLIATYIEVGTPNLLKAGSIPSWVWISLGAMMTVAINQGIARKVKNMDPLIKNLWGGVVYSIIGLSTLWFLLGTEAFNNLSQIWNLTKYLIIISGTLSIVMWSANLLSYKGGGTIAFKKIISQTSYLVFTLLIGITFLHEPITLSKWLALVLYALAFCLFDRGIMEVVRKRLRVI